MVRIYEKGEITPCTSQSHLRRSALPALFVPVNLGKLYSSLEGEEILESKL